MIPYESKREPYERESAIELKIFSKNKKTIAKIERAVDYRKYKKD